MNKIDLKNKVAIVTGGAQGFGLAIVEKFLASDEVSKPHLENFDIILSKERNEPNISQFIDDFENIINENLTKQQIVDLTLKYLPTMSHEETNKSLNSQI